MAFNMLFALLSLELTLFLALGLKEVVREVNYS